MIMPAVVLLGGTALGMGLIMLGLFNKRIITPYRLGMIAGGLFALFMTIYIVMAFGIIDAFMLAAPYSCMLMGLLTAWLEVFVVVRSNLWPTRPFQKSVKPRGGMESYNKRQRLGSIGGALLFLLFGLMLLIVSVMNLLNYGQVSIPNK
jgi:uncharacterized membrane protein